MEDFKLENNIDMIVNGYKFTICQNHPSNKSKYRIVHFGIHKEGAIFGENYVYNTLDRVREDLEYYTSHQDTYQIRREI